MTISARIIADSVSPDKIRLTTMQLRYPRFVHAEFMTHRQFSRNASSSRAIPVERLIKDILGDPVTPSFWGKNQKGMQADEELNALIYPEPTSDAACTREQWWDSARKQAIEHARVFAAAGYHKQIVNRILEPFSHINVVVTSTEWSNFYALRRHEDAQPEIRELADRMFEAQELSEPKLLRPGQWHLPYVTDDEHADKGPMHIRGPFAKDSDLKLKDVVQLRMSVARCARVSYLTTEGKRPLINQDLDLYERLVGADPLHASPAEHQATPDTHPYTGASFHTDKSQWCNPEQHGNFRGWRQYRKLLPGECK